VARPRTPLPATRPGVDIPQPRDGVALLDLRGTVA
jgi:hypothetical protein